MKTHTHTHAHAVNSDIYTLFFGTKTCSINAFAQYFQQDSQLLLGLGLETEPHLYSAFTVRPPQEHMFSAG